MTSELDGALPEITVAAGIIRKHGAFLAAQRPDGKPYAGYWELPGGKAEKGETAAQALCRELAEELAINVRDYVLLGLVEHAYPDLGFRVALHFFDVLDYRGAPVPKEKQNLRWVEKQDLRELVFLPADQEILRKLFPPEK